jgi:hypothetical protein
MIIHHSHLRMADTPPAALAPALSRLWQYWHSLTEQTGNKVPGKADIRISGLGATLPNIVISERVGPDEMLIRLAGSAMEEMTGKPLSGLNLLDLTPPSQREGIAKVYNNLFLVPCGFHISESLRADGGKKLVLAALVLPLLSAEGDARFTIGQYSITRNGFDEGRINAGAVIEHRQIDTLGYVDVGFGLPENHLTD